MLDIIENGMIYNDIFGVDTVGIEPKLYKCCMCGEELQEDYFRDIQLLVCSDCEHEFIKQNMDKYFDEFVLFASREFTKYMWCILSKEEQSSAVKKALLEIPKDEQQALKFNFCNNQHFMEFITERILKNG